MNSQIGRAGLNIGVWVMFVSGVLLFVQERESAEFYISLITFLIGSLFTLGIAIAIKLGQR